MQGKGLIKFFLVVLTLVCLVQYLYLLPTRNVERAADDYAAQQAALVAEDDRLNAEREARTKFLDSMSTETVFSLPLLRDYTYQDLKAQQLALGLDLKGGMSVVLQVDLRDWIKALANNNESEAFTRALDLASERQKSTQSDYITLFADAYDEVTEDDPNARSLAMLFANRNQGDINTGMSNGEVVRLLREKADETVDLTFKLLKERIDKLGVTQPNVSLDEGRDLIVVELPGIDNPERARTMLQATANLEFWNVYRMTDAGFQQALFDANEKLRTLEGGSETAAEVLRVDTTYVVDSLGNTTAEIASVDTVFNQTASLNGPLFDILTPGGGAIVGTAVRNQRDKVIGYLQRPEIRRLFPDDVKFLWAKDPIPAKDFNDEASFVENTYRLYAIRMDRGEQAPLTGERVTNASAQSDPQTNAVSVSLKMDNIGSKVWGRMTTAAAQDNNREIAIVLDDEVVSAPFVQNPITSGDSQITGNYSVQEATDLANILQVGKLPAETTIIQESLVGPSLGAKNIESSVWALVIGFLLVLVFMIVYYGGAGVVSILALLLNVFFIFGALASYGTVLTLPGVAGILLTIGMAVDANVIIYERVREELREGKSLLVSIQDGFANSYSAIIDANVTTILVAFVLAYFGLGPIKGFAVVLIIGVLCSLFTAVLVGRLMIDWWTSKDRNLTFNTGMSEGAFSKLNINWLSRRKLAYTISGAIIGLGILSMVIRGFDWSVDFTGGYSYNIQFEEPVDIEQLRSSLTTAFGGDAPVVKEVSLNNTYNVITKYQIDNSDENAADLVMEALYGGVNEITSSQLSLEKFRDAGQVGTHVVSSTKVGPTIADDITNSALYAAIFSLLLIFLYIFIRFSKWQYSMGAVAALFHDVLFVLSIFSIFHGILPFAMEIDQAFVAAILTVIGYSINDTVVVFDRIREFMGLYLKRTKEEVINMAINSTVSRTIITSLTTLFVVAILFFFGGDSIKGFAFALMVGIIVGTYSSIFIATPVMADLSDDDLRPQTATKKDKRTFSRAKANA